MPFFDHYPYTNFHNVNLDWVLQAVKAWGQLVEQNNIAFHNLEEANEEFKTFVTEYLQNLDVQEEINIKLDELLASGSLTPYLLPYIGDSVSEWLEAHISETVPAIDNTLTVSGAGADAKIAGQRINRNSALINTLPISGGCYGQIFQKGYISNTGEYYENQKNIVSAFISIAEIKAIKLPLSYAVRFAFFTSTTAASYIEHSPLYTCGSSYINYTNAPDNANFFRIQLSKQNLGDITDADLSTVLSNIIYYSAKAYNEYINVTKNTGLDFYTNYYKFDYGNLYPLFIKGSRIISDGSIIANTKYLRSNTSYKCTPNKRYFIKADSIFSLSVNFYSNSTVGTASHISRINFRYNISSGTIFVTPENAEYFTITGSKTDDSTMTDNDIVTANNSIRVCTPCTDFYNNYNTSLAKSTFIEYMNTFASKIGMQNSLFTNASGLLRTNRITPIDAIKMIYAVLSIDHCSDLWSLREETIYIGGSERTLNFVSNVYASEPVGRPYKLLGGKGGSLGIITGDTYHRAKVAIYEISGKHVAVALMGAGQYIYNNIVDITTDLLNMCNDYINNVPVTKGQYITAFESNDGGYCCALIPDDVECLLNSYNSADIDDFIILENNKNNQYLPCSVTKTLTMICACYISDNLNTIVTVNQDDISGGSGTVMYQGDKVTLREAIGIAMMESNNTVAESIGSVIGMQLLANKHNKE